MKKVLLALLIGTALFGQDCTKMLQSANKDFKDASTRWDKNSDMAAQYSIRGQEEYSRYVECMNVQRHKEVLKAISQIKLEISVEGVTEKENFGTGY